MYTKRYTITQRLAFPMFLMMSVAGCLLFTLTDFDGQGHWCDIIATAMIILPIAFFMWNILD